MVRFHELRRHTQVIERLNLTSLPLTGAKAQVQTHACIVHLLIPFPGYL